MLPGPMHRRGRLREWEVRLVAARQKWRCGMCRRLLPHVFEMDHVRALSHGGDNRTGNFQALCPECHRHKSLIERYCGACGIPLAGCRCRDGPSVPTVSVEAPGDGDDWPTEPAAAELDAAELAATELDATELDAAEPLSDEARATMFQWARYTPRPCPACGTDRCRRHARGR